MEQADTIAAAGVTTIWLPPPTDSVSQQGYMPTDLYNLNSRYGSEDELRRWGMRCGEGMLLAACTQHNHGCRPAWPLLSLLAGQGLVHANAVRQAAAC